MWQDLLEPAKPVDEIFGKGEARLVGNSGLRVEILSISATKIDLVIGGKDQSYLGINKETAKQLSAMFAKMYKQLEE